MIELSMVALVGGALAALSSALAALFAFRSTKRTSEVEIKFPDGRKHMISMNVSGAQLRHELDVVEREIFEAAEHRPAS